MSARSYLVELGRVVDECTDNVNDALRTLRAIRNEVMKLHTDCNISQTVGTSVKGLGVLGIIAGIIFPPLAIAGAVAAGAGAVTSVVAEAVRTRKNVGYGDRLKRVANKINGSNDRLKSTAAKLKNLDDGTFNFSIVGSLYTNGTLCNIEQLSTYIKDQIEQGAIMVACAAIVFFTELLGLSPLGIVGALGASLLLGADIVKLVDDWNRAPPLQKDIDDYITELLRMKETLEVYKRIIDLALKKL